MIQQFGMFLLPRHYATAVFALPFAPACSARTFLQLLVEERRQVAFNSALVLALEKFERPRASFL